MRTRGSSWPSTYGTSAISRRGDDKAPFAWNLQASGKPNSINAEEYQGGRRWEEAANFRSLSDTGLARICAKTKIGESRWNALICLTLTFYVRFRVITNRLYIGFDSRYPLVFYCKAFTPGFCMFSRASPCAVRRISGREAFHFRRTANAV
jgi:hypothetical protein